MFSFVLGTSRWDTYILSDPFSACLCFFFLALFLPPIFFFQVTTNISSRSGANDRQPGGPPGDESNASRFRWNAKAVATGIRQMTWFACKLFLRILFILLASLLSFVSLSSWDAECLVSVAFSLHRMQRNCVRWWYIMHQQRLNLYVLLMIMLYFFDYLPTRLSSSICVRSPSLSGLLQAVKPPRTTMQV